MNCRPSYRGYRFPPEIISRAVWLYHRFTLSLRDNEDLMAECNVIVPYESTRQWCATFGLDYARRLRKGSGPGGERWFLDEMSVSRLRRPALVSGCRGQLAQVPAYEAVNGCLLSGQLARAVTSRSNTVAYRFDDRLVLQGCVLLDSGNALGIVVCVLFR